MKKFVPIIILFLGIILVAAVLFVSRGKKEKEVSQTGGDSDTALAEVKFSKRPYVSLTPNQDGHWLTLKVEKILIDVPTMDYEILYKSDDGRTMGVPGSVKLDGNTYYEKKILLGSESSGKYRYDEGVESGTVTLRFRDAKGKLAAKFISDFVLSNNISSIETIDGEIKFEFDKITPQYFVVMNTIGLPDGNTVVKLGPYGIFSAVKLTSQMSVSMKNSEEVFYYDENHMIKMTNPQTDRIGVFASI